MEIEKEESINDLTKENEKKKKVKIKIDEEECKFKAMNLEEIQNLYLEICKKSKKGKIGLMYSVFDITEMSAGKEKEYEWCKNLCDILIICIKITPSIKTILNIENRIKYAEKSGYFDYILLYETNEDIENYLKYLKINILIKGYYSYHYLIKNK